MIIPGRIPPRCREVWPQDHHADHSGNQ
jgi:hypothetical protein